MEVFLVNNHGGNWKRAEVKMWELNVGPPNPKLKKYILMNSTTLHQN
jgi:hypothetical protein